MHETNSAREMSENRTTFDDAVSELLPALKTVCLLVTRDPARAEEVAQETLVAVWTQRDTLRSLASLRPWAVQIARRKALDLRRADNTRHRYEVTASHEAQSVVPTPHELLEVRSENALMLRALDLLPVQSAEILLLLERDGYTSEEVGALLGMRPSAVRKQAQRGREHLRRERARLARSGALASIFVSSLVGPTPSEAATGQGVGSARFLAPLAALAITLPLFFHGMMSSPSGASSGMATNETIAAVSMSGESLVSKSARPNGRRIRGCVTTESGAPVSHARVALKKKKMELSVTHGDANGCFTTSDVPEGEFDREVRAPDFETKLEGLFVVQDGFEAVMDVQLRKPILRQVAFDGATEALGSLRGTLDEEVFNTDVNARATLAVPLSKPAVLSLFLSEGQLPFVSRFDGSTDRIEVPPVVTISLRSEGLHDFRVQPVDTTNTQLGDEFLVPRSTTESTFVVLHEGRYLVTSGGDLGKMVDVRSSGPREIVLPTVSPERLYDLEVVDSHQMPVAGARLRSSEGYISVANAEGHASVYAKDEAATVYASAPEGTAAVQLGRSDRGQARRIELTPRGTIEGMIAASPTTIRFEHVTLDDCAEVQSTTFYGDRYRLDDLPAGELRLVASHEGEASGRSAEVLPGRVASLDVGFNRRPTGSITGRILAASGNNLRVALKGQGFGAATNVREGRFELLSVSAGHHFLVVTSEGRERMQRSVFVNAGQRVELEDFVIPE